MTYYAEVLSVTPPRWRQASVVLAILLVHLALLQLLGRAPPVHREPPPRPLAVRLLETPAAVRPQLRPAVTPPLPQPVPPPVVQAPPQPAPVKQIKAAAAKPQPEPAPAPLLTAQAPSPSTLATPLTAPAAPPAEPRPHNEVASASRAKSLPVAPPAPAAHPEPVLAARFDADYLQNPKPVYPRMSIRLAETGKVLLRVRVSADGRPLLVEIEKGSGFSRLDQAAHAAVTQWRFIPARQGETPIEATVLVPLSFALDQ